jgi:hypothetical protein
MYKKSVGNVAMTNKRKGLERRRSGLFQGCVLAVGLERLRKAKKFSLDSNYSSTSGTGCLLNIATQICLSIYGSTALCYASATFSVS